MVIYTPIYLSSHLGFTWKEIAMIFTIMLSFCLYANSAGKVRRQNRRAENADVWFRHRVTCNLLNFLYQTARCLALGASPFYFSNRSSDDRGDERCLFFQTY